MRLCEIGGCELASQGAKEPAAATPLLRTPQRGPRAQGCHPRSPLGRQAVPQGQPWKTHLLLVLHLPTPKLAHSTTPSPRRPRHLPKDGRGLRARQLARGPRKGVLEGASPCPPRPRGSSARLAQALPEPYLPAEGWAVRTVPRSPLSTSRAASRSPSQSLQRGLRLHYHHRAPSGCAGCTGALSGPPRRTGSPPVRMRTRPPTLRAVLTLSGLATPPDPPAPACASRLT